LSLQRLLRVRGKSVGSARAQGCASSRYPFLTQKERDVETGLDYFLARYYSSPEGRFVSPDEFTGGPDFAATAANNATLYGDPANPQPLNKYAYVLNRPLALTDPTGHIPCCLTDEELQTLVQGGQDVLTGVGKSIANIVTGMANTTAMFTHGSFTEPFAPTNNAQAVSMLLTDRGAFFGSLATGRAQVGGVVIAETESTTVTSSHVANEAAVNLANEVQQLHRSVRPGAAGAVQATNGQVFTASSGTKGAARLHPVVQGILDNTPPSARSATHGACCEPKLASQMLYGGVNPKGATYSVVNVRGVGNPNHAMPKGACSTCSLMLDALNK
jgi:RHS repeat-associated protein